MNSLFEFEFGLIFWQAIILLVTFFVLGKYAWKPILDFMHNQEKVYAQAAQKAEEQTERAERLAQEHKAMVIEMSEERKRMLEEVVSVRRELLGKAKQEALAVREAMVVQAKEDIVQEREATVKALRTQVGLLSVQLAEKLLQRELSEGNKQDVLLKELVAQAYAGDSIRASVNS